MINRKIENIGVSTAIDTYLTEHDFLSLYQKSTMKMYRSHLKYFFKLVSNNKDTKDKDIDLNAFKKFVDGYFKSKHNYDKDMELLIKTLDTDGYSNLLKKNRVNTIRVLMYENDIKLHKKIKKVVKNKYKNIHRDTDRITPTPPQLKTILEYAEPKGRALFLISSSSGMRIDELLSLTMDDIDLSYDPPKINVRTEITKTKNQRTTFMSYEAKEALLVWLKERDGYLKTAVKKATRQPKKIDDDTVFCFSYSVARSIWNRLLTKSGFYEKDKSTGMQKLSIHCLRSYFKIHTMGLGEISELLLGHTDQNQDAYRGKYPLEKKAELYLTAMPNLSIFSIPPDLTDINKKMDEKDKQIKELQKKMEKMEYLMDQKAHLLKLLEMQVEQEKIKNKLNSKQE